MQSVDYISYIGQFHRESDSDTENSSPSHQGESGQHHESGEHGHKGESGGHDYEGGHHNVGDDHHDEHEGHEGNKEAEVGEGGGGGDVAKSPKGEVKSVLATITQAFGAVMGLIGLTSALAQKRAVDPKAIEPGVQGAEKASHEKSGQPIASDIVDKGKATESDIDHMSLKAKKEVKALGEHLTPHPLATTSTSKDTLAAHTVGESGHKESSHMQQLKDQKSSSEHHAHSK